MTEQDNPDLGDDQLREELAAEKPEGASDTENKAKEVTEEAKGEKPEGEESGDEGEEGEVGKPFEDTDKPDVATRNASAIIARQRETIGKLRSKKSDTEEEDDKSESDDGGTEEVPGTKIAEEVSRQLKPFTERLTSQADEAELKDLFIAEPEAKGYEKSIRAYMEHEAWSQVPVAAIYSYLSRSHTLAQGAKRKEVADKAAAHSRGAGSQRRPTKGERGDSGFPSATEIDQMSAAEIEALAHKVETGQFQTE